MGKFLLLIRNLRRPFSVSFVGLFLHILFFFLFNLVSRILIWFLIVSADLFRFRVNWNRIFNFGYHLIYCILFIRLIAYLHLVMLNFDASIVGTKFWTWCKYLRTLEFCAKPVCWVINKKLILFELFFEPIQQFLIKGLLLFDLDAFCEILV